MKKKLLLLLSMGVIALSSVACSDNDNKDAIISKEKYPLMAFAVKVDKSYYHAKIDQTTRKIVIGAIENANTIGDVDYTLMDENTTISPDPHTFLNKWKKEQTVTVTTADQKSTTYTIELTKFNNKYDNLLFIDEFDLDGTPDSEKWVLCKKAGSDWNDEMSESYDQAYVEDGKLILKAEKVGDIFKAGGIETQGKFDFTFGRVEVKARITHYPNGAFPAIWLMPKKARYPGWPNCGEIDMMEHIKQEAFIHHTIHTNYTYTLNIKDPSNTGNYVCNFEDYKIYALEWTNEALTFFVDGVKTFSYPNLHLTDEAEKKQWPFSEESSFYLILNMGLGGDKPGSWAGPIDQAKLPAIMEVDWVKVFKLPNE